MPYVRNLASLLLSLILTLLLSSSCFADYGINVSQDGTGSGKVSGPDFTCFSRYPSECARSFPAGTEITLTASAAPGSVFSGWSGACSGITGERCTVMMNDYKRVSAIFNSGGAVPDLDAGTRADGAGVSINSLGEVAWAAMDEYTQRLQIVSSMRAPLTDETWSHDFPAVNSLGDAVWIAYGPGSPWYSIQGIFGGQKVKVAATASMITKVDMNDRREVVWSQDDGNVSHIYSSVRGQLTAGPRSSFNPSINNNGDVVYLENDPVLQDPPQVYRLSAGSSTPVALTADALQHFDTAINDAGEVVWSEYDQATSEARLVSSVRGLLRSDSQQIVGVDVNNCGDVAYSANTSSGNQVFRRGSNSPCVNVTGTHDTMEQAAPAAMGDIFTALADSQGAPETWYRFDASAGDDIRLTINYDHRYPNLLYAELYGPDGYSVAGKTFAENDSTMGVLGRYVETGSYLLKVVAREGRSPYSVSFSKYSNNCGAGPCPEALSDGIMEDGVAINSLGVVAWSRYESTMRNYEIITMLGGIAGNSKRLWNPAINDLSEGAWLVSDPSIPEIRVEAVIDGQIVVAATGASEKGKPGINNKREIVWSERDGSGIWQIHSSLRGQLTSGPNDSTDAAIDNSGNIAYIDDDRRGHLTVMKIPAGSTAPVAVKEGLSAASSLSIADSGELTWVQPSASIGGPAFWQIESSSRGTLLHSLFQIRSAAVNSCGDVAYMTDNDTGTRTVYRFGNNSPCVSSASPTMEEAAPVVVGGGDILTGVADSAAAPVWYRFDAGAGDTIRVAAHWDINEPNYVTFGLYDANGNFMRQTQGFDMLPLKTYFTAPAAGPYFLKVEAYTGRSGYAITIDRYVPPPFEGFPVTVVDADGNAAINSLGEVVWVSMDYVTGSPQIYSSLRGQLTHDDRYALSAVINDLGDLAWVEGRDTATIKATIGGKTVTIAENLYWPGPRIALTNQGEVVWSQYDAAGVSQIFSSTRGQLTTGSVGSYEPDVNDRGDIVFRRYDQATNRDHIYSLPAGSAMPQRVNPGSVESEMRPVINDQGEIIWRQNGYLFSNLRGDLHLGVYRADLNNCGDIVYEEGGRIYRLGYSSPCVSNPGAHDTAEQAAPLSYAEVSVGLADSAAPISWYRLEGSAGDTIHIRVNYDNTGANVLAIGLYDAAGNLVAAPAGAGEGRIDYTVPAGGVYFLKVEGSGGRFGYAVSLKNDAAPLLKLMVEGVPDSFFSTLAEVFASESAAAELKLFCRSGDFTEDVAINQCGKVVRMEGGYDSGFSVKSGKTRISGKLKLSCGNLLVDGLTLR